MPRRPAAGFLRRGPRSASPRFLAAGSPAAVPFRPGSWDVSGPVAFYVLEQDDTMYGLAARYLGNGARWTEIKAVQTDGGQTQWGPLVSRNGTAFFPGDGCTTTVEFDDDLGTDTETLTCTKTPFAPGMVLRMPEEAKERMLALLASGEPRVAPSQGNAPGNYPGNNPLEPYGLADMPVTEPKPEPKPKKSGGGLGLFVLLAGAAATAALS